MLGTRGRELGKQRQSAMDDSRTCIVITDCDHGSIEPERQIAREAGVRLVAARCTDEDSVISAGRQADGLIVQYAPVTARVLDALPRLRVVSRYGVGVDTIDVDAARAHGVRVCHVPDYCTEEVSDHAIAMALAMLRGLPLLDRQMRAGETGFDMVKPVHRFRDQIFGVVGLGRIGQATAAKAQSLGFDVVAYARSLRTPPVGLYGIELIGLDALLRRADVVSLHVPLVPATRHLINAEKLVLLRPQAVLVNTSRGGLVDTEALMDAVQQRRIRGAALDVFEEDPLPGEDRLRSLPGVLLTPHVGWYSEKSFLLLKQQAAENAIAVCLDRQLPKGMMLA
ncbi:C-terminal binding protein [Streptomyces sp. NPDC127084]|uniref:C-terminal binding protein n=1 Tax=Streptomyces sp. NPDC127084 TaxID=3347133 RepID=UPI00364E3306